MEIRKISSTSPSPYQLGRINSLPILRLVSIGAYLAWDNEEGILLPLRYLPEGAKVGDEVEVFVYHDNEGRLIATTLRPRAVVGELALMPCVAVSQSGAFMDWGIHKDLFVPFAEQQDKMQEGRSYLVYLYIDYVSGKIVGSAKLNKHIGNRLPDYKAGTAVSVIITGYNEVGYRCVVEGQYWGMIYFDSTEEELSLGEVLRAYVVRTREDGKLDLSLNPVGYARVDSQSTQLIRLLRQNGGKLPIGDKSPSAEIARLTGLSKKSFKMAVGKLYKERRITIEATAIKLIN